ncbi:MAG: metabolite traffic protein EboE [Planctomycetes bacterium]|nr:metabolite traffic protein EboE [Planctomycetota bacterium]
MWVKLPNGQKRLLAYEMNVHRGENLREFRGALRRWTLPLRARLGAPGPFGIAPRIGRGLLGDLARSSARKRLADELRALELIPYTVNAFPLEEFHARRVKERVYDPPWDRPARAALTCRVADVLAVLLPAEIEGSISTLGGTYRPWGDGSRVHARVAAGYLRVISHLVKLERRTGRRIVLAVEPEPDTTFEAAADVIRLVEDFALPNLRDALARPLRMSAAAAERAFREHFTVNLDVCHQSVLFRDPVAEWRLLERHGLRVGKLHITSALALRNPRRGRGGWRALGEYDEPRYLHQFAARARASGEITRGVDLGDLARLDPAAFREVRVHFHVPLSAARLGPLATTRADTARALAHAARHADPPHLAIETYTWPLIERRAGAEHLIDGIAGEFRWTLRALRAAREP